METDTTNSIDDVVDDVSKNDQYHQMNERGFTAIIYLNRFLLDKGTMTQIRQLLFHPSTEHMRIMPDAHRGSGCCVGYTSHLTPRIVPKFIGGDIGCGMISYPINVANSKGNIRLCKLDNGKLDLTKVKLGVSLPYLDEHIRQLVPMGKEVGGIDTIEIRQKQLNQIWPKVSVEAYQFADAFQHKYGVSLHKYIPDYSWQWFLDKTHQIGSDFEYDLRSLGTLGGGNHFIEVNYDASGEHIYVSVHSGSRNIGQKICGYHQSKINDTKYFDREAYNELEKKYKRQYKGKQLHKVMSEVKEKLWLQKHPDYLEAEEAYHYFFDMIFAQNFAQLNRQIILNQILSVITQKGNFNDPILKANLFNPDNVIESIHNYIDFEDFIVRKGAIRATKDKKCIIALNMKEGVLLCHGKGNLEWNLSAAHGAGRVINRQEAYHKLKLKQFESEMVDVYSQSVLLETLDESPMVYRNKDIIKEALVDTVDIIEQLYPIINLKGLN